MRTSCAIGAPRSSRRIAFLLLLAVGLAIGGRALLVGTGRMGGDERRLRGGEPGQAAVAGAARDSRSPGRAHGPADAANRSNASLADDATVFGPIECLGAMHHDFGVVTVPSRGIALKHVFTFRNRGPGPKAIRGVSTTCGCTVATWPSDPVQAGGTIDVPATLRLEASGRKGVSVAVAFDDGEVISRRLFAVGRMPCEVASPASAIRPDAEGWARVPLLARTDVDVEPPRTARLAAEAGEAEPLEWQPLGAGTTRRTWTTTLSLRLRDPAASIVRLEFEGGGQVDLPVSFASTVSPGAVGGGACSIDASHNAGAGLRGDRPGVGAPPTPAPPSTPPQAPTPPQTRGPQSPQLAAPAERSHAHNARRDLLRSSMTEDLLPPLPSRDIVRDRCRVAGLPDASRSIVEALFDDLRAAVERVPDDVLDSAAGRKAAEVVERCAAGTLAPPERERQLAEFFGPVLTKVMTMLEDLERTLVESAHAALPVEDHDRFDELIRALRRANHLRRDTGGGGFTNGVDFVEFVREWSVRGGPTRAPKTDGAAPAAATDPTPATPGSTPSGSPPAQPMGSPDLPEAGERDAVDRAADVLEGFDPLRGLSEAAPVSATQALRYSMEMDVAIQGVIEAQRLVMPRLLASMRRRGVDQAQDDAMRRPEPGSPGSDLAISMAPINRARVAARALGERHAQELAATLESAGCAREGLELVHAWRAASARRIFLDRESPTRLVERLEAATHAAEREEVPPTAPVLSPEQRAAIRTVYLDYLWERETLHRELVGALGRGLLETGLSLPLWRVDSRLLREWTESRQRRLALADRTIARILDLTGAGPDSPLRAWMRAELERVRVDPEAGV